MRQTLFIGWAFWLLLFAQTASARDPVTVFLAGDSTMAEKRPEKRPETGWGEMLQQFFDAKAVRIANRAMNGRSTRTFITENRWQAIVNELRKGDYVFIQFGHNDGSKEKTDRYTPPDDYRRNLVRFVNDVRAKEANPILLTPVARRRFDAGGNFFDTHGEYPDIVRSMANELKVAMIDMHRASEAVLKRYGAEDSKKLFLWLAPGVNPNYPEGVQDNTHFNPLGASEMAKLVVESLQQQNLDLARFLTRAPQRQGTVERGGGAFDRMALGEVVSEQCW